MKKNCPFCTLDQIDQWRGCDTDFHEGVAIAETVLPKTIIDRVKAEGNTPVNAILITEAVATARSHTVTAIEEIREMLARYDAKEASKKKVETEKEAE